MPLHLSEPAQAWEDESRLSHQAVLHELKMLTTMLLKLTHDAMTETLGRASWTRGPCLTSQLVLWHANAHAAANAFAIAWQSIAGALASAGPKMRKI